MTIQEAIKNRHAVRSYTDRNLEENVKTALLDFIGECNRESGLHIQLVTDEPKAFDGFMAHYGKFGGVENYIALIGKKNGELEEKCGYYGEKIALYAQTLGLNTCWVAMSYSKVKGAYTVEADEKLLMVISLGYGKTQGVQHKSKTAEQVSNIDKDSPEWFRKGVEAALLAPTAMNQQKFMLKRNGNKVSLGAGTGLYVKTDLGIVKYHFEEGAGRENFGWEEQ
ncbi:MAG: nitroreductase [Oscillospiraceae bacterium]|nr:nitroreductase [Oscillospiraceae bacterium]